MILQAFIFQLQQKRDSSKACYYKALRMAKNSNIKLSCILMLLKMLIEDNDLYGFVYFFDQFQQSSFYDSSITTNVLFSNYKKFSRAIKFLLSQQDHEAIMLLHELFAQLNDVDSFLEEKILTFLAYGHLRMM